jgi:adenosylmethionine-8-amino-7-oxononanoate aminotransferase
MSTEKPQKKSFVAEGGYFPRSPHGEYLVVDRGEGIYLYDRSGRRFIDGSSGAAVACLGHAHPRMVAALAAQAGRVAFAHTSVWVSEPLMELADRLVARTSDPDSRVYFASGGSEAVETALKLARTYQLAKGRPDKHRFVSRNISYHGATMGALSMTGLLVRRTVYSPLLAPFPRTSTCYCYRCPFGLAPESCRVECASDLDRTIVEHGPSTLGAFIVEPVVGASAPAVTAHADYMRMVADICHRHDTLLVADEVMSGVGRTGRFFGMEHYADVQPDITVLSKGISAGYAPLAAVIVRGHVFATIRDSASGQFAHGLTYSGNPLSAAVGLEAIKVLEEDHLIEHVAEAGKQLFDELQAVRTLPMVGDVRGRGLLLGIEFVRDPQTKEPFSSSLGVSQRVFKVCLDEGLVVYPGTGSVDGFRGDHILLAPPYIITAAQVSDLVERLMRGLRRVQEELGSLDLHS